jgi:hypothetical protein
MHLNSKTSLKTLIAIIMAFTCFSGAYSQSFSPNSGFVPYWQVQLNTGTSLFFGDVKQYQWWPVINNENEWRGGVSVLGNKQISPVFGVRGQFVYGKLAGTRRVWSKHFINNYLEFNLNTTININNLFSPYRRDRLVNTYIIFGLGLLNYNTYVYQLGSNKLIQTVGGGAGKSFGGRTLEGVLHGGLGLDFRINDRLSINLETANRIMNSDMLDGHVSGFKFDVFNYTAVGVAYKFAFSKKHSRSNEPSEKKQKSTKSKTGKIETVEYDYNAEQPIQPPVVSPEVLVISPKVVEQPEIKEPEAIVEQPVTEEPEIIVVEKTPVPTFEYRVQILAKYGKTMSLQKIGNMYNIPADMIKQNTHNGYYIYTIGSFSTYESARQKRNQLRMNNGISDAFVVAFKNGERLDKLP